MRNFILHSMWLAGEVKTPGWGIQVDRERLAQAVEAALRGRPIARTSGRRGSAGTVTFIVCEDGLSVRSGASASDIPAVGMWASPIAADGFMVLRVLARITDHRVDLAWRDRRLGLNERSVRGREV